MKHTTDQDAWDRQQQRHQAHAQHMQQQFDRFASAMRALDRGMGRMSGVLAKYHGATER